MRLHRLSERLEWHLFPPVFSEAQALDQRHEVDLSPACATLGSGWLTRAASLSPQGAVSHAFTTRTLAMFSPPPTASHNGLEAVPGGGPSNCHSPMQSSCNRSHPGNPPIRRHSIPPLSAISLARPYITDAVKILPKKMSNHMMQGSVKYHFFASLAGRCLSVFPDAPTHVPGWAYQSQPHDNGQPSKSILECGGCWSPMLLWPASFRGSPRYCVPKWENGESKPRPRFMILKRIFWPLHPVSFYETAKSVIETRETHDTT